MGKDAGFLFDAESWLSDEAVRSVSLAARGLWIDMLSLMRKCGRKGYLSLSGKPMTAEQLANAVSASADEVSRLLTELRASGAFSATEDGTIYNRRMVREEKERENAKIRMRKYRLEKDKPPDLVTPSLHDCSTTFFEQHPVLEEENKPKRKNPGKGGVGGNPDPLSPDGLTEAFCRLTVCPSRAEKRRSFVKPRIAELLRRGIFPKEIWDYIHDEQRPRTQFLWDFLRRWPEKSHSRSAGAGGDSRVASPRGKYDGIGRQVGSLPPTTPGPGGSEIPAAS